jgi:hypothetical protein
MNSFLCDEMFCGQPAEPYFDETMRPLGYWCPEHAEEQGLLPEEEE